MGPSCWPEWGSTAGGSARVSLIYKDARTAPIVRIQKETGVVGKLLDHGESSTPPLSHRQLRASSSAYTNSTSGSSITK